MRVPPELPDDLMRYLADAELEVLSWSAESGKLVLAVTKEIGPEVGLLEFVGVSRVDLPPRFTINGFQKYVHSDGDTMYKFDESWGDSYSVIAEALHYEVSSS